MREEPSLTLSGGSYRLGVIGDPVVHSLSPALHQPALDELRIPAVYERWQTPVAEIASRVESLRDQAILGASVTLPHKVAVLGLVDDASLGARRAGAVNTVVSRGGALFGDNTDIHGFSVAVSEALAGHIPPVAVVLGAGGAARAVVLALEAAGVGEIVVANRDVERASSLTRDLAPAPVHPLHLQDDMLERELPRCGLLVNATSLGWHPGETPIALLHLDRLPQSAVVADLTYRDTDLLLAARERKLTSVDGLLMLVHQGARAFELWTGYPAPVGTMLKAARIARGG